MNVVLPKNDASIMFWTYRFRESSMNAQIFVVIIFLPNNFPIEDDEYNISKARQSLSLRPGISTENIRVLNSFLVDHSEGGKYNAADYTILSDPANLSNSDEMSNNENEIIPNNPDISVNENDGAVELADVFDGHFSVGGIDQPIISQETQIQVNNEHLNLDNDSISSGFLNYSETNQQPATLNHNRRLSNTSNSSSSGLEDLMDQGNKK
jgi:hypothetical protein